jgi:hypothetical protein
MAFAGGVSQTSRTAMERAAGWLVQVGGGSAGSEVEGEPGARAGFRLPPPRFPHHLCRCKRLWWWVRAGGGGRVAGVVYGQPWWCADRHGPRFATATREAPNRGPLRPLTSAWGADRPDRSHHTPVINGLVEHSVPAEGSAAALRLRRGLGRRLTSGGRKAPRPVPGHAKVDSATSGWTHERPI